jgi:hypothetical protein
MNERLIRAISIMAGFITGLLLMSKWQACHKPALPKETMVIHTVYDSVPKYITARPEYITIRDSVAYPIPDTIPVDTGAILRSLFTAYYQEQVLRDSSLEATISDSLYQNRVLWRGFSYKILRPLTITEKKTAPPARLRVFLGAELSAGKNGAGISPVLLVTDKQNKAYTLRNSLFEPQPNIALGIHFNILNK